MPHRRTIVSILRTVAYAGLCVVMYFKAGAIRGVGDALLAGAILADYVTWFIWSIIALPAYLAHGCYEAGIHIAVALVLVKMAHIDLSTDSTGELAGVMFVAFLIVGAAKICYLEFVYVEDEIVDDE